MQVKGECDVDLMDLDKIEAEYRKRIEEAFNHKKVVTATEMVELSATLFRALKVSGISGDEDADSDMLLYQYGVYGTRSDKYFEIDVTRQFIEPNENEPYQLSLTLKFEPELFGEVGRYNCWSSDFSGIEEFVAHIKTTDGFKLADKYVANAFQLHFEQC